MLTLLAALLIGQATVPTTTQETGWTDPATGEIVYSLEQRPADAMARGCLFGRVTVRCPNPSAPVDYGDGSGPPSSAATEVATATSSTPLDTSLDTSDFDALFPDLKDGFARIDAEAVEAEAVAAAGRSGRSEPASSDSRPTCRREERRSADGSSTSVQVVCGSGDQDLMDDVMERLRPD
jgi:hypothetical protein